MGIGPEIDNSFDPSRRWFLELAAGTGVVAAASRFFPRGIARAQEQSVQTIDGKISRISIVDPTNFTPITEAEMPVIFAEAGVTTDEEINNLPPKYKPLKIESLGGGIIRYSYLSPLADRPSIIIAQRGGKVLFKRRVLQPGTLSYGKFSPFGQGFAQGSTTAAPGYYSNNKDTYYSPVKGVDYKSGIAAIMGWNTGDIYEIQTFVPTATRQEYEDKWGEGDYLKTSPKSFLLLFDGLGSFSNSNTFQYYSNLFDLFDQTGSFSYSGVNSLYGPRDTYQDIDKTAAVVKESVDDIGKSFDILVFLCYSLGGNVVRRYLEKFVLPKNGIHKDGILRSIAFLDTPLNGVPRAAFTTWGQMAGIQLETQAGNEATQFLSGLARNPEAEAFTTFSNEQMAKFLKDYRRINILTLGNSDDCLVPEASSVIPGFGQTLSMGNVISDCDNILSALIFPGKIEDKIGHSQILHDPRAKSQVEYFFRNEI